MTAQADDNIIPSRVARPVLIRRDRRKGPMRRLPAAPALLLAAAATLIALAVPASATTVATTPRFVPASSAGQATAMASSATVLFSRGMLAGKGGSVAVPATLPSCRAITYRGNGGAIHVQTSANGTVVWGIYMYDSGLNAGPWTVDVYVRNRRVDHKNQNYPPHGSVNPKDAKKGAELRITATHYATANQTWYHNVPNGCIIP